MFLLDDDTVVYSASDLAAAASCEFALLRALDAKLGRTPPLQLPADAMLERAARLGDRHEERVLDEYVDRFGPWDPAAGIGVAQIDRPDREHSRDRATLRAKHVETTTALRAGADVVFQAGFFDGRFGGWADFLVREPDGAPVYAVHDTKLARHAKVTALLQLAAYADQMLAEGIRVSPEVHLVLGDRTTTSHRLADLLPVYRDRRARLQVMLDEHQAGDTVVAWGDERYRACGRCDVCTPEVESRRDVLLVAGMRTTQRARLRAAGITTIDELAAGDVPVDGIGGHTLAGLREQARLQVEQDPPGRQDAAGTGVVVRMHSPEAVEALPAPDPGDIFFDFEGDPLWTDARDPADWGLEYLFGLVEQPERPGDAPPFRAFWAHDRAEEKQALVDFLEYLTARRRQYPGMHVYHYASYEKTALLRLAGRHGVGEEAVDQLLREGVLVDLYSTVRHSLRTGQRSYSLKKLEPLFMDVGRSGEVTTADASITEYADACLLRDSGDTEGWHKRLDAIADYNAYDCLATLRLRDWLRATAAVERTARGSVPADDEPVASASSAADGELDVADGVDEAPEARDQVAEALLAVADDPRRAGPDGARTPDQQALALLAASLGYHRREDKPFWWAHFDRLRSDPADWTEKRSTFVADPEGVSLLSPWSVAPGKRAARRRLRMVGRLEPGSELRAGAPVHVIYDPPVPPGAGRSKDGHRGCTSGTVVEVTAEGHGLATRDVLVVEEGLKVGGDQHGELPMALGPGTPPKTDRIAAAIRALAGQVADAVAPSAGPVDAPAADTPVDGDVPDLRLPDQPALDLLRRRTPRTLSGRPLPLPGGGTGGDAAAITEALLDLDHSYLAVQGPPGTGKTFTGACVVADLVARGWRIGVVAQSHAVVENLLRGIAKAGVDPGRIGKKANGDDDPGAPWTWVKDSAPSYRHFYDRQVGGYVVGGTAWDLTHPSRLPTRPLDLLVVDEAGQFSLANTVAVSTAARNLLLLGDPQQLPQVSQGRHPEPVDRSALGWLTDGHDTLPSELGYFLARTWRMHPDLCAVVSHLSYEDRLGSMPCTAERSLESIRPGVHCVHVEHEGNSVASEEEAAAVVDHAREVVGRRWQDPATGTDRPLAASDVIVVAPYNAQVWTVRRALDAAGLGDVRVGTVDKFQGQQAPVVLVTTAASSADDVPRGMEFLLNRNRINVAVSRGLWCAVVISSRRLTEFLPRHPAGLEELGAFLGLCTRPWSDGDPGNPAAEGHPVAPR